MFVFVKFLEVVAFLTFIVLAIVFVRPMLVARRVEVDRKQRKRQIGGVSTYEDNDGDDAVTDVRAAQKASLAFLGLSSVHAGHHIMNVPTIDPEREEGWEKRRMVITASRITALLRQGAVPGDFVELDGGYALFASNGKTFLLQKHNLTTAEEAQLEQERKEAVEKNDPIIPNFQGAKWRIGTACGSHTPRDSRDGKQSTIQVLSSHPKLGQDGTISCLPSNLLDNHPHDYYDMRVRSVEGDRVMLFFFAGGTWACFMGRELGVQERGQLQSL